MAPGGRYRADPGRPWHRVVDRLRRKLGRDAGAALCAGSSRAGGKPGPARRFPCDPVQLDWFYAGGAGGFYPDLWANFLHPIPEDERGDLIGAYHRRLFSGDYATEARHARHWAHWENALASVEFDGPPGEAPADYARAFARLENHYFHNGVFLEDDGQILRERHRIEHIPATIVQGRLDMICPPVSAWKLAQGWARAQLRMVPAAGHALSEPGITAALVGAMNGLRG